ncbi:MAG: hypothetical protein JWR61_3737 [Ferruginibacter sp.]|jgi:hypothetical protein|uniref:hypothetical protein n=1 Tax=Ferruginibacter sp. TaxID=1940288 RepID=UPI002659256E|nr:hypothetical protein [Ferruginibacter sp.]MDB5278782.1 hypothetical protein [Ferruginibacter sp.]
MKKLFVSLAVMLVSGITASYAQTTTKVEPVTTAGDKVHNVLHPKHKRAHGVKVKREYANGNKKTTKLKTEHSQPLIKKEN